MTNPDLTAYIDRWLDENGWRLDDRMMDFVLDVRLMASGEQLVEARRLADVPQPVAA